MTYAHKLSEAVWAWLFHTVGVNEELLFAKENNFPKSYSWFIFCPPPTFFGSYASESKIVWHLSNFWPKMFCFLLKIEVVPAETIEWGALI